MRVWITEIGEPLPLEEGARLHRYGLFSRYLADQGHDVTWWTSTFSHAPKKHILDHDDQRQFGTLSIRLLHGPGYSRNVSLARIYHQSQFAKKFAQLARRESQRPDVLISPIPTIEVAHQSQALAKELKCKFVTDIRDEWPDELLRLAPRPLRPLGRLALLKSFSRMAQVCKSADSIVGVSPNFLNYGLSFAQRDKGPLDALIPLGYSMKKPKESKVNEAVADWKRKGVDPDKNLVICFFGTIGRFFDLKRVLATIRYLRGEVPIQFVVCGSGSRLAQFKDLAADLPEVLFPGWVGEVQIHALMKLSHAGLAPYKAGAQMSLTNKVFEYFAGSIPVISSSQGELRDILEKEDCGLNYNTQSEDSLVECFRKCWSDSDLMKQKGRRAFRLLENKYSTEIIFPRYEKVLERLVGEPKPSSTASVQVG